MVNCLAAEKEENMQEKNEKLRLDRFLVSQNIGSRKEVTRLIRKKAVTVDEEIVTAPEAKICPGISRIAVSGHAVHYRKHLYIMMNKPVGVLSATKDNGAETVLDLLPPHLQRRGLFPAGRLDKDTTGLLIITDDGAYAHHMLSPKKHVYKKYMVQTERKITQEDVRAFAAGIRFGEIAYAPAKLEAARGIDGNYSLVCIREGKFHQVKRMFEARENPVLALKRLQIGNLYLDEKLPCGGCKALEFQEAMEVFSGNLTEFFKCDL